MLENEVPATYKWLLHRGLNILLILLAFSIPLPILVNSYIMIATFIVAFFYFIAFTDRAILLKGYLIMFVMLYLLHLIAFFTSSEIKPVFKELEQKAPLILLPLLFSFIPRLTLKSVLLVLSAFIISTGIVCLLSFRNGFYLGYHGDELYESLLIHRPYLGMYCVMCIFFCVLIFRAVPTLTIKISTCILITFFAAYLFVLFAKMAIVAFVVLSVLYVVITLIQKRKIISLTIIVSFFIGVAIYTFGVHESGRKIAAKVITFSEFDWETYDERIINSLNLRFIKWSCTAKVLEMNNNWLLGVGLGDSQKMLNSCYEEAVGKNSFLLQAKYDSHNEFLTVWLNLGLIPLLFFILHFVLLLQFYIQQFNVIALLFTVGIIIFGITESIFEVQKGIVFYAFFQSLFLFHCSKTWLGVNQA